MKQSDVWVIVFAAIFMTLVVLVIATAIFWDQICARIMINALEYGAKQLPAIEYNPPIPPMRDQRAASDRLWAQQQSSPVDPAEEPRAEFEASTYQQRFDEAVKEAERKAREWHPELFQHSDPNKR